MSGVLVAGIGNVFFGDDAFGVEVAGRLLQRPAPDGVVVADYGIRGLHLAHELLAGYDLLVLVDALAHGEEPGTVTVLEVDPDEGAAAGSLDAHSIDPNVVLAALDHLGGSVDRVLVVGCEPATCDPGMGLSPAVAASVDVAVETIDQLLRDLVADETRREIP